jgi:hypothetical protein
MTVFSGIPLNRDGDNIATAARWDATLGRWVMDQVSSDGGDPALGATTDNPTASSGDDGSLISRVAGLWAELEALIKSEDAAHTTGDPGVPMFGVRQDVPGSLVGASGDYTLPQMDAMGAVRVATGSPSASATNATTTALAASLVVKASAGRLMGAQGYTSTAGFVQVHNAASVPAESAVPVITIPTEAGKNWSIDFGALGRIFSTGITIVYSTTGPIKTIGSAEMWADAQYF